MEVIHIVIIVLAILGLGVMIVELLAQFKQEQNRILKKFENGLETLVVDIGDLKTDLKGQITEDIGDLKTDLKGQITEDIGDLKELINEKLLDLKKEVDEHGKRLDTIQSGARK